MELSVKFSIIVVCLNAGNRLNNTLDSILSQTYDNYEVIVKDGGSTDGSTDNIRKDERIRFTAKKDTGIYDAMNQAVSCAAGEYVLFLNCGDTFFDTHVLEKTAAFIENNVKDKAAQTVLYGDTFSSRTDALIASPRSINGFACYRNIPCHQSCFYSASLCVQKPYNPEYRIRADYEHFLWCYYKAKADMYYMGFTVSAYEGGGYSESKKNIKRSRAEHKEITANYMSKGELLKYRLIMALTLAPLRSFMADNKIFSGFYHKIKRMVYK